MFGKKQVVCFVLFAFLLALVAGCQAEPQVVEKVVTEVVEKEVTRIVEGTPIVETVVETKIVEVVLTPTPESEVEEPAVPASEPLIFTAAIPFEIKNADPAVSTDFPGGVAKRTLYDTLVELHGDPIRVEPGLSEKWEANDDLTEWTFHLTDKAVFHDGSPVTADAVKYSFDRQMSMATGYAWMWADYTDENAVSIIDDYTVKFTLTKPFAFLPQTLSELAIVNPVVMKQHETDGDWGTNWLLDNEAGSGPFTITRWEPGTMYEFEKFADYWKPFPSEASPDIFRYVVYREAESATLGLISGEVSWIGMVEEEDAVQLAASGTAEAVLRPALSLDYIFMNTQSDGPIGDVNVRKAIAYAFDYEAAWAAMYAIEPTYSVIPMGLPGAIEVPDVHTTDLDLAKAALAESAWPDGGFEVDFVFIGGFAPEETAGLILLDSLQKLNITVNLVSKTWSEMVEMCSTPESAPDMINIYTAASYPDPYPYIYQSWGPVTSYDFNSCSWFFDDRVAELLQQASSEIDQAKRDVSYAEIQQILWENRFGIVVGNASNPEGRSMNWKTVEPMNPLYGYLDYVQNYEYVP